jgi:outer membrane protein assembly factor BamB
MDTTRRAFTVAIGIGILFLLVSILTSPASLCASTSGIMTDQKINDDSGTALQESPDIAVNRLGHAVIVWHDLRAGTSDIYGQVIGHRGFTFRANFKVNSDGVRGSQMAPRVSMNAWGRFVVVWESRDSDSTRVYAQLFAANGERSREVILVAHTVASLNAVRPDVAMDSQGNFVVCWADYSGADAEILMQCFDLLGNRLGTAARVNDETPGDQIFPAVARSDNGFVIVWHDTRLQPDKHLYYEIFAQRYDANGLSVGPNLQVSHHASNALYPAVPAVAMQVNQDFMVSWRYGAAGNIYAASFDSDGSPLSGTFAACDTTRDPDILSDICPVSEGNFGILWRETISSGTSGTQSALLYRVYTRTGTGMAPALQISETAPGMQSISLAFSLNIGLLAGFSDSRSGNSDIHAAWLGPETPLNLSAGSGFGGIIPVTWDAQFGRTDISKYKIMRSLGSQPYSEVATVDLALRGILGSSMRDWVDSTVTPGVYYFYTVQAAEGSDTGPSLSARGIAALSNPLKHIPYSPGNPIIDGILQVEEWSGAAAARIDGEYAAQPITLFLQHNYPMLYLAIDDPNDTFIDPGNNLGLLFDLDHNFKWDPSGPSKEGLILISRNAATFTGYWGSYPNALGADAAKPAVGISYSITTNSGHAQYEIAIDCSISKLATKVGYTCGLGIWLSDPSNVYASHYGNAGEWPKGSLWECARTLGQVVLDPPGATPDPYGWPMIKGDQRQSGYAGTETGLKPPFAGVQDFSGFGNNTQNLAAALGTLVATGSSLEAGGSNALYALDAVTGAARWKFVLPGSVGSVNNNPCITDSLVLAGAQGSPGLYALSRTTGAQIWFRALGDLRYAHPLVDGAFVYICRDSLYCLDLLSGRRMWSVAATGYENAFCLDDTYLYWADGSKLSCRDKMTGALHWQVPNEGQASVVVDENAVYTFHNNNFIVRHKNTGAAQWFRPIPAGSYRDVNNVLTITDDALCVRQPKYSDSQTLYVMNKVGTGTDWQRTFDSTLVSPPVSANGVLYLVADSYKRTIPDDRKVCMLALDMTHGDTLFIDYGRYTGSPIIAGHRLYVGMETKVRVFSMTSTAVETQDPAAPGNWRLLRNFPNPFNASTMIRFRMQHGSRTVLRIFNISGQLVRTLIERDLPPGEHQVLWDGRTDNGEYAATGIYLVALTQGGLEEKLKVLLLK